MAQSVTLQSKLSSLEYQMVLAPCHYISTVAVAAVAAVASVADPASQTPNCCRADFPVAREVPATSRKDPMAIRPLFSSLRRILGIIIADQRQWVAEVSRL